MKLPLLLLITMATVTAAWAEPDVDVSGEVRVRAEIDAKDFDPAAATRQFTDLRTRVAFATLLQDNTRVFVQIQDSRRFGGQDADGADLSGTLNNGRNVDMHQAFVRIGRLWRNGLGLQAGRFELNLGNQRVFGAVGWHNVGRSWDGASLFLERSAADVAGYWLRRRELDDPRQNRDFDVYGINARLKKLGGEIFLFQESDADAIAGADSTGIEALNRTSAGLYLRREFGRTDIEINGVYQFGDQRANRIEASETDTVLVYFQQDIAAFLITCEVGHTFASASQTRIAIAVDYASGDDDPSDSTYEAYDNLYYTGHKFRGFMDYFLLSEPEGLLDFMLRGQVTPSPGWLLGADFHYFRAAADVNFPNKGPEIDLYAETTRVPGAELAAEIRGE